ncbi:MAG: hypothetical protein ACYTFY_10160 [Planctomycetota bacterium]|jgi:hypothetical protein
MLQKICRSFLLLFFLLNYAYGSDSVLKSHDSVTQVMLRKLQAIIDNELAVAIEAKPRKFPQRPSSKDRLSANNGVSVYILEGGKIIGRGQASHSTLAGNLRIAAALAVRESKAKDISKLVVMLEIFLGDTQAETVNPFTIPEIMDPGRQGARLLIGGNDIRVAASDLVLSDKSIDKVFKEKLNAKVSSVNKDLIFNKNNKYFIFNSVIALVFPGQEIRRIYRFNRLLHLNNLNYEMLKAALSAAKGWYLNNQNENGTFPAGLKPLAGEKKDRGGWLGSRFYNCSALSDLSRFLADPKLEKAAAKNLDYLVENYYLDNPEQRLGYVKEGKNISLGSAAALLDAIIKNKRVEKYKEQVVRLVHFLNYMRQTDGKYRAYMNKPLNVTNVFFPGQTQLSLLRFYNYSSNAQVLGGVAASFKYYRAVFDQTLALDMVPWHTSAYTILYKHSKQRPAVDLVFKMNDLLVSIQDNKESTSQDQKGRFVKPLSRSKDHAGENALYVSGLLDAFNLAVQVGDNERADRYRKAVVLGIRYLLQLQIIDRYDTWCMPEPEKASGGFKDSVDNYYIRLDNQAYCISALSKALQVLSEPDFRAVRVSEGL